MEKSSEFKKKRNKDGDPKSSSKRKIIITIVLIIFAISGSFITYFILQLVLNTSTPVVVVVSGSMEPTISKGDLLFVQGVDGDDIENGTIIVFWAQWSSSPADPVVHRVINKYNSSGIWYFITKGDANLYPDPAPVSEHDVLGVVVGRIPYIGWIKIFLTDSYLLIPLIVIIIFLLIISIGWDLVKENREKAHKKYEKSSIDEELPEFKKKKDSHPVDYIKSIHEELRLKFLSEQHFKDFKKKKNDTD
ncbi:MAG: signal peptidase I [Promethearchaeota archaeon]